MDWSKLDARLTLALAEGGPPGRFAVFVELDPLADPDPLLAVLEAEGEDHVRTAALSSEEIGRLSERPEIRRIGLSRRLRPLDQP